MSGLSAYFTNMCASCYISPADNSSSACSCGIGAECPRRGPRGVGLIRHPEKSTNNHRVRLFVNLSAFGLAGAVFDPCV